MSEGEKRELDELRRRVFGPGPDQPITDADLRRLRELEGVETTSLGEHGASELSSVDGSESRGERPDLPTVTRTARFSALSLGGWLWIAASGIALLAIGFWVGIGIASGGIPGAGAQKTLPEFANAQTEEDMLPVRFLNDDSLSVDPDTTRFVAVIDGYFLVLGQPAGSKGICIVSFRTGVADDSTDSTTCSGSTGIGGGGMSVHITDTLEVGIGDAEGSGTPVRLSESVTAYRH